jgi:hypothetical protein
MTQKLLVMHKVCSGKSRISSHDPEAACDAQGLFGEKPDFVSAGQPLGLMSVQRVDDV